jgi:hypothetical protein
MSAMSFKQRVCIKSQQSSYDRADISRRAAVVLLLLLASLINLAADILWEENFEGGAAGWGFEGTTNVWQIGMPTYTNGPVAHSGSQVAGTRLAGNYPAHADARLVSPQFVVPAASENPRLKYWYWYCLSTLASGQLQIRVGTNTWQNLPVSVQGCAGGWSQRTVDLSAYAGQTVQIGFYFGSYVYLAPGWYIDGVEISPFTPLPPVITVQPQTQAVPVGSNITLRVLAIGTGQLFYQWRFNGQNIPGATNMTLALDSVSAASSGGYSVLVWSAYGSVVSATAYLSVLTDGANGNQPVQITAPFCPAPPPSVDSLILVTHGWEWVLRLNPINPWPDVSWITNMCDAIRSRVPANYDVRPLDWRGVAWYPPPLQDLVLWQGVNVGKLYGKALNQQDQWQHVHLIAHSAGSAVIEAIAAEFKSGPNPPVIHETFLDPYTGWITLAGRDHYGANADWADCYFAQDNTGYSTRGKLVHAHNVDVSWRDPAHVTVPFGGGDVAYASHAWPYAFYLDTVTNTALPPCAVNYGFVRSEEGSGWNERFNYPVDNTPIVLCGPQDSIQNPNFLLKYWLLGIDGLGHALSGAVNLVGNWFTMTGGSSPLMSQANGPIIQNGGPQDAGGPAWLAVGVPITNTVNYVQFEAGFTSSGDAQGLLTVYWNTNQIGMVDERVASPGLQTYRFALPETVTEGLYTLSFRLDAFSNTLSSITVTNVATGFAGVEEPIELDMLRSGNNYPILKLTGASNFTYLIESSTNLADWTPTVLLLNTNGTAFFFDPAITNYSKRFYRALLP